MRSRTAAPRGLSVLRLVGVGLVTLVVGAGGAVGGLLASGHLAWPWAPVAAPPSRAGLVPVPLSGQRVAANTVFTRDHLIHPKLGDVQVLWVKPEDVPAGAITSAEMVRYLGQRVLNHDKQPGYAFTEADFHPPGTRPGFVAKIPADKQAMVVEANRVVGLQNLQVGDTFDLWSAVPHAPGQGPSVPGFSYGTLAVPGGAPTGGSGQASVKLVVRRGLVVTPVTTRVTPETSHSLVGGQRVSARPVQEVTIALAPAEVVDVTRALSTSAMLFCVAHSGQPDAEALPVDVPAEEQPAEQVTMIETRKGTERRVEYFAAPTGELLEPPAAPAPRPREPAAPAEEATPAAEPLRPAAAEGPNVTMRDPT